MAKAEIQSAIWIELKMEVPRIIPERTQEKLKTAIQADHIVFSGKSRERRGFVREKTNMQRFVKAACLRPGSDSGIWQPKHLIDPCRRDFVPVGGVLQHVDRILAAHETLTCLVLCVDVTDHVYCRQKSRAVYEPILHISSIRFKQFSTRILPACGENLLEQIEVFTSYPPSTKALSVGIYPT